MLAKFPFLAEIPERSEGSQSLEVVSCPPGELIRLQREILAALRDEREAATPERKAPPQATASFTWGTIQKAVSDFADDVSQKDVSVRAKFSSENAKRVRLMMGGKLLRLNAKGKLWVDERVRRDGTEDRPPLLG